MTDYDERIMHIESYGHMSKIKVTGTELKKKLVCILGRIIDHVLWIMHIEGQGYR